jgi:hypothetical protein
MAWNNTHLLKLNYAQSFTIASSLSASEDIPRLLQRIHSTAHNSQQWTLYQPDESN